ncbi:hypothetical protein IAU59_001507 [Kwoniella sp. CBS 9459]
MSYRPQAHSGSHSPYGREDGHDQYRAYRDQPSGSYSSRPRPEDERYAGQDYDHRHHGMSSYHRDGHRQPGYPGSPNRQGQSDYHQPSSSYRPLHDTRSGYIPPHLRNTPPFPPTLSASQPIPVQPDSSRHYSTSATSSSYRPRDRTPTPPPMSLPSSEYLELSKPTQPLKGDQVVPKLLVLDLNGALVYRNRSSADRRKSSPRPYLQSFLEYVFLPDLDPNTYVTRPWEVFVWSSAQPHNVRGMVEGALGTRWSDGIWDEETDRGKAARESGEGRLLGVWARDKMGLAASDYTRRVQTTKDLRKVLDHLQATQPNTSEPAPLFDQKTIMLLDDSPLKAIHQPFNQLVIPEFGHKEHIDSKRAISSLDSSAHGVAPDLDGLDQTLLAVVGVLDELKDVSNVPAWMRAGGLRLDEMMDEEVTLETLPSHAGFSHWFKDPPILKHWVEAGKVALQRRGIEIRHGIEPDSNVTASQSSSPSRTQLRSPMWKREASYSPSRPTSPTQRQSRGASPQKYGSSSRRDYSTSVKVDDDELPDDYHRLSQVPESSVSSAPSASLPSQSTQALQPYDLAGHLDRIIDNYSSLTVNQKNQLRSASMILSRLPATPVISTSKGSSGKNVKSQAASTDEMARNGNGRVEKQAKQPGEPSHSVFTASTGAAAPAAAAATAAPSTSGSGDVSGSTSSSGKKKARFEAEFAAAKKLNGQLSKQTFRAQRHLELTRQQDEMRNAKQARKQHNIARESKKKEWKEKRRGQGGKGQPAKGARNGSHKSAGAGEGGEGFDG